MTYKVAFPDMMSTLHLIGFHFRVTEPGWTYPDHHHKIFELLYCYDGSAIQYIDQCSIPFSKGDWLVIPPGLRHHVVSSNAGPYVYLSIHFDIDDLECRRWFQAQPLQAWNHEQPPRPEFSHQLEHLDEFIKNSILVTTAASTHYPEKIEGFLLMKERLRLHSTILMILSEIMAAQLQQRSLPAQSIQQKHSLYEVETAHWIEQYMMNNLHSPSLSIQSMAEELCLSRVQCHKLFSKVYKISPRQYMTSKRLQQAKYLLVYSDLKIQNIAEQLGFASQSHFSRQFKRWTGMSPLQYRPRSYTGPATIDPFKVGPISEKDLYE